jgi:hypothetical protein
MYTRTLSWMLALSLVVLGGMISSAAAQTADSGKWEVEFHGGGMLPTNPTAGTVSLPGPSQVFATAAIFAGSPVFATSRRESSWYFGDGATLVNQVASALAARGVTEVSGRIATLDPVLARSLGERRRGGSIGARVSRELTARFSAELSVDYSLARLELTPGNSDSIEATRASFAPAFNSLILFNPNRVVNSLTSTASVEDGGGHQWLTSGALVINLKTDGNLIPYATVGASLISITGKMPSVTLTGNYRFVGAPGAGAAPIDETDNVTVKDARNDSTAAGMLGGGLKYQISRTWGVRLDARLFLSKNTASTVLDATPTVALGLLPAGGTILNADPTIQWSNTSSDSATTSTLTGPPIKGLRTFSGSGVASHTNITAGLFWRF